MSTNMNKAGAMHVDLPQIIAKAGFTLAEGATHVDLLPTNAKKGFTLAEVLITLGIIGIVAAMTIPQLQNTLRKQRMRTQFLKSYSSLQQVFKKMEADDVVLDSSVYGSNSGRFFFREVEKYVKPLQVCFQNRGIYSYPCYNHAGSAKYKNLTGTASIPNTKFDDGQIVLMDGTLLLFESPTAGSPIIIFVDINGYEKLPNRLGYDLFAFQFVDGTLKTMGDSGTTYIEPEQFCKKQGGNANNGMACAFKALKDPMYFKNLDKPTD